MQHDKWKHVKEPVKCISDFSRKMVFMRVLLGHQFSFNNLFLTAMQYVLAYYLFCLKAEKQS